MIPCWFSVVFHLHFSLELDSERSRLLGRYYAPITERWLHLDTCKSRFTQHLRYLPSRELFTFCPPQHNHVERRNGKWSRLLIVIEHLMDENMASGPNAFEALVSKEATFLWRPVMINH